LVTLLLSSPIHKHPDKTEKAILLPKNTGLNTFMREKRHILSNIDTEARTAFCSYCNCVMRVVDPRKTGFWNCTTYKTIYELSAYNPYGPYKNSGRPTTPKPVIKKQINVNLAKDNLITNTKSEGESPVMSRKQRIRVAREIGDWYRNKSLGKYADLSIRLSQEAEEEIYRRSIGTNY
jgi:hypothetical protein